VGAGKKKKNYLQVEQLFEEHVEQAPEERVPSPPEPPSLKEEMSFSTSSPPQNGHTTASPFFMMKNSNSLSHFLHLNSNIGILSPFP
jgi:hypothetical protein